MDDSLKPNPPSKANIFFKRFTSTLILWAIVSSVFISRSTLAFLGVIGLLIIIATWEYFRMLRTAKVPCFPRFGMLSALAYCAVLYTHLTLGKPIPALLDACAIFLVLTGAFSLQLRYPIRGLESLSSVAYNLTGFVYIVLLFNFASRLIHLSEPHTAATVSDQGAFLIIWLLAVTKFTDMGAYITGSLFGRHKMIPHVSPGKTWEGFAGAIFFALLAGCGLYACFPAPLAIFNAWPHVIILSIILALLAVIGDLAESIIKRTVGAKDSGHMLAGIGGSLDLIDSLCLTAPALFFYLNWLLID